MMTATPPAGWKGFVLVLIAYALICSIALGFDLFTDRSFGAVMLSVLPISVLALGCLVVGPWLRGERKRFALQAWFIGALQILIVSTGFSLLGADQAKTGEVVFTYAAMIMALPSSLVLPLVAIAVEPLLGGNVIVRIVSAWVVCVAMGWLEWKALGWGYGVISTART